MRLRNGVRTLRTTTARSSVSTDAAALVSSDVLAHHARPLDVARSDDNRHATPIVWAHRVIDELSHDLRQPLTAINMNLQCAMRLLQSPNPRLSPAVEALSDCLNTEAAIVDLLEHAQRRLSALLCGDRAFSLNLFAEDLVTTVRAFEPLWADRLERRLTYPAPCVTTSASRMRMALLALLRRLLLLEEFEPHPLTRLVIETRAAAPHAELRVSGIPPASMIGPFVRPLFELLSTIARGSGGEATLHAEDQLACLVIVLPLRVPLSSADGDSLSSYGGADGE